MKLIRTLFLILFLGGFTSSRAQNINEADQTPSVVRADQQEETFGLELIRALNPYLDKGYLSQTPKGAFYATSIALVIDEKGQIVGAYTSLNLSPTIRKFLKPGPELLTALQKTKSIFGQYWGKTVILPVMFVRWGSDLLEKSSEFKNNIVNLWPDYPPDKTRPVVLLKPRFFEFDYPSHH